MHNARARLMAALAGATLCLFAVTSDGQNPAPTTGAPDASAQAPAQPTTPAPTTTDPLVPGTATEVATTTETTTWSFPGGIWGILAVGLLAIFMLCAVFRGRKTTVVNETYVNPNTGPTRNAGMGTAVGDRNLSPRAASGTEPRTGGVNEPPPNTRL